VVREGGASAPGFARKAARCSNVTTYWSRPPHRSPRWCSTKSGWNWIP
jgi:hypothetical protein